MSQINTIKEATDIVQIIGERIELQRGGSNLKAVCPFHSEKTPSFFVSESLQRFRCFGCGEMGDVYTFLEKYEGMTFAEALRYLADRAGIELQEFQSSAEDEGRQRLYEILDLAKEYFHYLLVEHEAGEPGREYLKDRNITNQSRKIFQLGYSMPQWDGLLKYLHHKKKYSLQDLEAAGLILKGKRGRYYDRFRGRLMFPLTNKRGQVVGFSGRSLNPDAKEAKYINSPETLLYHKSELLYGYSQLYQSIRQEKEVIVVEGEMDVISSSQVHVNHVVALKGSALTKEQAQLLRRTVDKVLLALDNDDAGVEATKRAIPIAQEFDLELRVIPMAGGKDPDELSKSNPKAWRELTQRSISVYQFFINAALQAHGTDTPEGKRAIINELAPILGQIKHAVEKDYYLKKLAAELDVSLELVRKDVEAFKHTGQGQLRKQSQAENDKQQKPLSRRQKLEQLLWFLLLRYPELPHDQRDKAWSQYIAAVQSMSWTEPRFKLLHEAVQQHAANHQQLEGLHTSLPEDVQQLVTEVYLHPEYIGLLDELDFAKEWQQARHTLHKLAASEKIEQLTQQLDELDEIDERTPEQDKRQRQLLTEIIELKRQVDD